jgi:hypothetical protein
VTGGYSADNPHPIAASQPSDEALRRLYGLPLDAFTAERDALAKQLRDEGRRDDAATVKALKKPSLPAWAVNQLSRRHGKDVHRLLDAGESLRKAHEGLPARGGRAKLRAAADTERELVSKLVERARPLLSEMGSPSAANLERVRNTLHAAAGDAQLRTELSAGRVVNDREAVGLGPVGLAGTSTTPDPGTTRERQRAGAQRRALREAAARAERAAKQLRAAEARLERARIEAEQAERELRDRDLSVRAARKDAEEAEAALRRAEDRDR